MNPKPFEALKNFTVPVAIEPPQNAPRRLTASTTICAGLIRIWRVLENSPGGHMGKAGKIPNPRHIGMPDSFGKPPRGAPRVRAIDRDCFGNSFNSRAVCSPGRILPEILGVPWRLRPLHVFAPLEVAARHVLAVAHPEQQRALWSVDVFV